MPAARAAAMALRVRGCSWASSPIRVRSRSQANACRPRGKSAGRISPKSL